MAQTTENQANNLILNNDVILFMKGSPETPKCGYSKRVVQALDHLGVTYAHSDVLENADIRSSVKDISKVRTLPQLFIKGNFIGGSDAIVKLFESHNLLDVFNTHGISLDVPSSQLSLTPVTMDERRQCGKL